MASARLRWEPTLAFAPRWAEGHRSNVIHPKAGRAIAYLPPASNATFAAYATAFMKRYGPRGAFWKANPKLPYVPVTTVEVWNEPDNLYDWGQSVTVARAALADMRRYGRGRTPVSANEYGWTSIRNTWGSTNPKHVKTYAYQDLIDLAKLRLSEIEPFGWGEPAWGISTGSFARAVAKIHHR
jgi:hypothetical protein